MHFHQAGLSDQAEIGGRSQAMDFLQQRQHCYGAVAVWALALVSVLVGTWIGKRHSE